MAKRGLPKGQSAKRIIILLDGTWNDSEFGDTDTNIVRMRDSIARCLQVPAVPSSAAGGVTSFAFEKRENVVLYERGVGTGAFLNRFFGGAFGEGLTNNIRGAYRFLSFHYNPGDQIFVFGFSRGAYTARSLVGYIHAAGLLRREECTEENELAAWSFYEKPANERSPGVWTSLAPFMHDRDRLRIACVGVFDTVGALGIPLGAFRVANRDRYEFHDVELSSITDLNLHALAIDEPREPFQASVWRRSQFKQINTQTEQVWFPGAHADIGGGYVITEGRPLGISSIDDISLSWMIKRIRHRYPDFPITDCDVPPPEDEAPINSRHPASLSVQHNPRKSVYRIASPKAFRSIANLPVKARSYLHFLGSVNVSRNRHATVHEEMIHVSAIERLGQTVPVDSREAVYRPRNLLAVLPNIRAGLTGVGDIPKIAVVDWDGNPIAAGSQRAIEVGSMLQEVGSAR
jgi:hypothetical protein